MNIPVVHDDQHGTAIITAAGIINAFHLTNRDIKKVKIVQGIFSLQFYFLALYHYYLLLVYLK